MPLTNPAWEKNFRLQAATTGGNPLRKGDSGPHVAILRKNLEAVGFERSLEPSDVYGASTAGMIRDFLPPPADHCFARDGLGGIRRDADLRFGPAEACVVAISGSIVPRLW